MAILRKDNKERYTTVPAHILRDERLSLRDIGLLVSMLSLPDNWHFSEAGLEAIFPNDGITSVRSGLKALENAGYLIRERTRGTDGKVGAVNWYLYDTPQWMYGGPPQKEKPQVEKPQLDFPSVDKPSVENHTQYNTNTSNTKQSNTKEYNTQGFEDFWFIYPKKKAKESAKKAWNKLKPSDALVSNIIADVQAKMASKDWKSNGGQYIPYPATYLNGKRWEDEAPRVCEKHDPSGDLCDLINGGG